jgi:hypothetical protein
MTVEINPVVLIPNDCSSAVKSMEPDVMACISTQESFELEQETLHVVQSDLFNFVASKLVSIRWSDEKIDQSKSLTVN